jgi:uncharacterized membrane protein
MYRTCCDDRPVGVFSVIRSLFVLTCVLIAIFFVAGYASGWITLRRDQQNNTATIEIDTGEMKVKANQAAQKGEELIDQAGDKLRELGRSAEQSVPTSIKSNETTPEDNNRSVPTTPAPTTPAVPAPTSESAGAETIL